MNRYLLLMTTCLVIAAAGCSADEISVFQLEDTMVDTQALVAVENELWEAYKQRDGEAISRLVADDYLEVLKDRRNSKEHILRGYAEYSITGHKLEEVQVIPLGKEAAIVSYRLITEGPDANPGPVNATSVWKRQDGDWVQVLYQESS